MKRVLSLFITIALLAGIMSGCGNSANTAGDTQGSSSAVISGTPSEDATNTDGLVKVDEFIIGCANHITGPTALTGVLRKNGYELGAKEVNEAGGIDGLPIKIMYEDDQGTNTGAVAAAQKIMSSNKAIVFLIDRSTMVNAVNPIIQENEIPTLFGATANSIDELNNDYFFRMRVKDGGNAQTMAKYLVESLGKKKVAALYCADTFGEGGNTETKKALKENYDMAPVTEQKYTAGTKDYAAQLLAIKSADADAIYAWGTNSEDNAIILRQFKELGLDKNMAFIGSAAYASSVTIDLAKENADGIYSIYDFSPDDTRTELQNWYKAYKAEYNSEPDFWCLSTYDQVKLVADAAKRAGLVKKIGNDYYIPELKEARAKLADALRETDHYKGAIGDLYPDDYQNMVHNMAVVQIDSGKLRLIENVTLDQ